MNTPQHKQIQDVSTRWNSIYYMVERLLEQRWPVTATLSDPWVTPSSFDMKPDQWVLLDVCSLLGELDFSTVDKG